MGDYYVFIDAATLSGRISRLIKLSRGALILVTVVLRGPRQPLSLNNIPTDYTNAIQELFMYQ